MRHSDGRRTEPFAFASDDDHPMNNGRAVIGRVHDNRLSVVFALVVAALGYARLHGGGSLESLGESGGGDRGRKRGESWGGTGGGGIGGGTESAGARGRGYRYHA